MEDKLSLEHWASIQKEVDFGIENRIELPIEKEEEEGPYYS